MDIDMYSQSVFLIVKAAYLYYVANESQNAIASKLKISVPTVSRLLKKAKEEKIVEFVIRDPFVKCIRLEEMLRQEFCLKDIVIAPGVASNQNYEISSAEQEENVKKSVALEAARYLQRIIKEKDVLGITWGSTIYHMINYLNPAQKVNATFVTLHGSIVSCESDLDVHSLAPRIAKAFSGANYVLHTDALVSSKAVADIIKHEKNIAMVYRKFDEINISISGTGSLFPEKKSVLVKPEFMPEEDAKDLQTQGVYGDIALHFFNKDGQECRTNLRERMISIDFEKFKRIETKITLASGVGKAYTVLAALKGGLIDVPIIDYELGMEILRLRNLEKNRNGIIDKKDAV